MAPLSSYLASDEQWDGHNSQMSFAMLSDFVIFFFFKFPFEILVYCEKPKLDIVLIQKLFIALYFFTNIMEINLAFLLFTERKWVIFCFINF